MHADTETNGNRKFAWGQRHWLVLLVFLAIIIAYSDRVNISVAAVSMKEQLGWTQTTKGYVLSAFFVGYMAFMFVSGWLCLRLGGRLVMGIAVLWWSIFTLLTPIAAAISVPVLIGARIGMGLGEAAVFPAALQVLGRWLPLQERTRGVSTVTSGIPLGTVIGLLVTGWILGRFSWPAAFYFFGVVGVIWSVIWFATITDDPTTDPRTSPAERHLLAQLQLDKVESSEQLPWRRLLLRPAVWALVATHFATTWSLYMLLTWLPSFFRDVQHVSIANSGLLSAAPWLSMFIMTYVGIELSNYTIRRTKRIVLGRKLVQCSGLLGSAALLLCAQQAHSVVEAVVIACAATGFLGFCWAGYMPNFIDLAPRHSALLTGFSNTFATIPGIVGVSITGWLVDLTGGYTAAFGLAAGVSIAGAVIYMIYGSSDPLIE